jgi:hypothetical protein
MIHDMRMIPELLPGFVIAAGAVLIFLVYAVICGIRR